MRVEIIASTTNPIETIYRAFKQCYAPGTATQVQIPPYKEMEEFIKKWMGKGHESPIEHVSFTFSIEGVSRAAQQQLTRHRHASYSIQSQRYVDAKHFDFTSPDLSYIKDDTKRFVAEKFMKAIFQNALSDYKCLTNLGVKKEDARCILPLATTGNIVMTMNLRELRHFWAERLCIHAQTEIRELAQEILNEVEEIIPFASYKCRKCNVCGECKDNA